jgi:hypothetical protein
MMRIGRRRRRHCTAWSLEGDERKRGNLAYNWLATIVDAPTDRPYHL